MSLDGKDKMILVIDFITAFLYMLNHALLVPILPFLCDEMKATTFQNGLVFSVYSITQLISRSVLWVKQ